MTWTATGSVILVCGLGIALCVFGIVYDALTRPRRRR